jgi:hypothetical protein
MMTTKAPIGVVAAADAERQRIRAIEALGHEFGLIDAARILSCETSKTPDECKRIIALLVKAGADQKALADFGWSKAIDQANRIRGHGAAAREALPGTPEWDWQRAIAKVNNQTGLSGNPGIGPYNRLQHGG